MCDAELGATDYRHLAYQFQRVVLQDIPLLNDTTHPDWARRFITLVDELYEGTCALVCSTANNMTTPDDLFQSPAATVASTSSEQDEVVQEALGLEELQTQGGQPVSTLASVRELAFAFQRAASRITEMTSTRWWNQVLRADGWVKNENVKK